MHFVLLKAENQLSGRKNVGFPFDRSVIQTNVRTDFILSYFINVCFKSL